ncbi:MAG TPA: hypothetical protein VGN36_04840 [Sphingorhabdus sp.]|jgi:hypothetical protein|nr:hypothetical protein [Sphingorhabdus sp.]
MAIIPVIALLLSGAPAATASAKPEGDKVICKRSLETGSLVRKKRICHTKSEWARIASSHKEEWEEVQGTLGSTRGN